MPVYVGLRLLVKYLQKFVGPQLSANDSRCMYVWVISVNLTTIQLRNHKGDCELLDVTFLWDDNSPGNSNCVEVWGMCVCSG